MKPLTLLLIINFLLFSKEGVAEYIDNGKISGKVVDAANGEPIDYAVVNLVASNGQSPVKNFMTENGGAFHFSGLPHGTYSIRISFVGYSSLTIDSLKITDKNPTRDIGNITLNQDTKMLGEVVITEQKPTIEFDADKITYNVQSSLLAEGSVATDILKNVPSVSVDIDGTPTIAGKRNTRIFIDGKPSDFTATSLADLMNVLPSDAIEKVEVLTNPPAKFSSDGDGIINIVLKKGYKIGLNGSVAASAGTLGRYSGNGTVSYRTKKFSLTTSYGYRTSDYTSIGESRRTTFLPDTTFYLNQNSDNFTRVGGNNFRSGFDWDLNDYQNLRFSININNSLRDGNSDLAYHYFDENYIEKNYRQQNTLTDNSSFNTVFDADYTLKFKANKEEKITFGATLNTNNSDNTRSFSRHYFKPDGTATNQKPTLQDTENGVGNNGFDLKLDYDKPLKNKGNTIEAGMQVSLRQYDENQLVENFVHTVQDYVVNPGLSNSFLFQENIYSAYGSFRARTENRWTFRIGVRSELTDIAIKNSISNYDIAPYVNVFPNISISKLTAKRYNYGLSYSMRISRPRENALNPLVENTDNNNISFGNPNLKPAVTHQTEFSFGAFGDKWSFSPRLSYSNTLHIIERVRTILNKDTTQTTYDNIADSKAFSLNVFGNYRPTKKITANAGFTASQIYYETQNPTFTNRTGLSIRSNLGLSIQLKSRVALESNLNYYSNTAAQGQINGSLSSSFAARKSFLNNKLSLRLLANDPFNQRSTNTTVNGFQFLTQSYSRVNTRNFTATLSYRFTKVGRNSLEKQKKERIDLQGEN